MSFAKTIPFIIITSLFIQCGNDTSKKTPLLFPEHWRSEVIEFPLEFAPSLQYSGTEYICFSPGWGKQGAPDYFSCAFLWVIDQDPKLSAKNLETAMETYFDGLMNTVSKSDQNSTQKNITSKAFFENVNEGVYVGKILTYDAFTTKKEVSLNIIVNNSFCNAQNKHLILFTISPQAPDHQIWKKMKTLSIDMECE
ncbi:hypothetical protein [Aquimarina algiphila]|uniref:hypothetical protein n=1 Tax=Aquimarina algiphila TaxID=2047982 RepID=UPI00232A7F39|nr:hypothetical protein [Aquimarina algiphila]